MILIPRLLQNQLKTTIIIQIQCQLKQVQQPVKNQWKKKVDKENIIPKQTKRAPRSKKINEKSIDNEKLPNNNEEVVEKPPVLGKRKARVDYNPKSTKKAEIKLFQISNISDSTNNRSNSQHTMENTCTEIENAMKNVAIVSINIETISEKGRKNLKASNSANNLKAAGRLTRNKPTSDNYNKIETKKGRIKKSKSTSNVLTSKKIQLVASDENRAAIVKEINQTKSILKSRCDQSHENNNVIPESLSKKTNAPVVSSKSKKAVKILDKIDDKNDQISHFKIDNRTKYAASTSTPSGLRRRPLKAPQDISMIVTPNKKA